MSSSVSACPQHAWELPWALGGLTRTARVLALRVGHALTAASRASPYISSRRRSPSTAFADTPRRFAARTRHGATGDMQRRRGGDGRNSRGW